MALIFCPRCGNQVSDKAPACPHCGVSIAGTVHPQQTAPASNYGTPLPANTSAPAKSSINKAGVIVGIIIAVIVIIGAGIYFLNDSGSSKARNGKNGDDSAPTESLVPATTLPPSSVVPSDPEKNYTVLLTVTCRKNLAANQYDIDIIIDGNTIVDTLPHGTADQYSLLLSEGTHRITFRLNQVPDKMDTKSLYVDGDMEASYYVECKWGNKIYVECQ